MQLLQLRDLGPADQLVEGARLRDRKSRVAQVVNAALEHREGRQGVLHGAGRHPQHRLYVFHVQALGLQLVREAQRDLGRVPDVQPEGLHVVLHVGPAGADEALPEA